MQSRIQRKQSGVDAAWMEQLARRAELASQHRTAYGADVVGWRESGGHLWQRDRGDLLLFFPFFLSLSLFPFIFGRFPQQGGAGASADAAHGSTLL